MAEAWRLLCTCAYNGCTLELREIMEQLEEKIQIVWAMAHHPKVAQPLLASSKQKQLNRKSIYEGKLFVCHIEISPTTVPLVTLLVMLESLQ